MHSLKEIGYCFLESKCFFFLFFFSDSTQGVKRRQQIKTSPITRLYRQSSSEQPPVIHPSQAAIQCSDCKTEVGVENVCKTCLGQVRYLCDTCTRKHSFEYDAHDIVPRTEKAIREYELTQIVEPCPVHPAYKATDFCIYCRVACCMLCVKGEHKDHAIEAIEQQFMKCEDKLNKMVWDIEKNTLSSLQSNVDKLWEVLQLHESSFNDAKKGVSKLREDLKAAVDRTCDELADEVNRVETEQMSNLRAEISCFENQIQKTKSFISLCSYKVWEGGQDLIQGSKVTHSLTDSLPSNVSCIIPKFIPDQDLLSSVMKHVPEIQWEGREINLSSNYSLTLGPEEPDVSVKKYDSFPSDIYCASVVPGGDGSAWIANTSTDTMNLYGITGEKVRSVTVEKGAGITDLAVKQSGDIIVCNTDKKVRTLTVDDEVTTLIDTTPFSPKGMFLTEKEEIVLCLTGQDANHVIMYSPNGTKKN